MNMKRMLSLLCAGTLMCGLLSISAFAAEAEADAEKQTPSRLAEITAIDESTVTLRLLVRNRGRVALPFDRGQELPEDVTAVELSVDGEHAKEQGKALAKLTHREQTEAVGQAQQSQELRSEKPDRNTVPSNNGAEKIAKKSKENAEDETLIVDLSTFDDVIVSELVVGDLLRIEFDENGSVISAAVAERPEINGASKHSEKTDDEKYPEIETTTTDKPQNPKRNSEHNSGNVAQQGNNRLVNAGTMVAHTVKTGSRGGR